MSVGKLKQGVEHLERRFQLACSTIQMFISNVQREVQDNPKFKNCEPFDTIRYFEKMLKNYENYETKLNKLYEERKREEALLVEEQTKFADNVNAMKQLIGQDALRIDVHIESSSSSPVVVDEVQSKLPTKTKDKATKKEGKTMIKTSRAIKTPVLLPSSASSASASSAASSSASHRQKQQPKRQPKHQQSPLWTEQQQQQPKQKQQQRHSPLLVEQQQQQAKQQRPRQQETSQLPPQRQPPPPPQQRQQSPFWTETSPMMVNPILTEHARNGFAPITEIKWNSLPEKSRKHIKLDTVNQLYEQLWMLSENDSEGKRKVLTSLELKEQQQVNVAGRVEKDVLKVLQLLGRVKVTLKGDLTIIS